VLLRVRLHRVRQKVISIYNLGLVHIRNRVVCSYLVELVGLKVVIDAERLHYCLFGRKGNFFFLQRLVCFVELCLFARGGVELEGGAPALDVE